MVGAAVAAVVARSLLIERAFIGIGHVIRRRSHLLSTVHWAAEDELVRRLSRRPTRFRRTQFGVASMWIDVTDHTGRTLHFHRVPYEPETTRVLQQYLAAGDTFIDVGANIGFFSVLAALLVGPTGQVIAFEPHPWARASLAELASVNGVSSRIVVVAAAAAAEVMDSAALFLSVDSVLSTLDPARSPARDHFSFDDRVLVSVTTIDTWLREHPLTSTGLQLVKIDVEGVEEDVLNGMRETLAHAAPVVICETEPGTGADTLLRSLGYVPAPLDIRNGRHGNYLYARAARTLLRCGS